MTAVHRLTRRGIKSAKNISRYSILSNQHIDRAEKGLLEGFIKVGG